MSEYLNFHLLVKPPPIDTTHDTLRGRQNTTVGIDAPNYQEHGLPDRTSSKKQDHLTVEWW